MAFDVRLASSDVRDEPFPFAVVENALPAALADELRDTFPSPGRFARFRPTRSNQKLYRNSLRLLADPTLPAPWRDLLQSVPPLARRALEAFTPALRAEHPGLERRFGRLADLRIVEVEEDGGVDPGQIALDSRLIAHTPVRGEPSAERPPHVKNLHAILLAYLDLVDERDDTGGDYVLFRPRTGARIVFHGRRQEVDPDLLEPVQVVPRRHNSLILFANGPRSIQWISTRRVTPLPLLAHHFTLRLCEPVFDLPFAPGAGPTPFGAGLSVTRTLEVVRANAARWLRGLAPGMQDRRPGPD